MPNIKSSIRSVKTDAERRAKNAPIKAALRNASRKVEALAKTGAKEDAQATMATASGLLDKAARKGIIHKNAATENAKARHHKFYQQQDKACQHKIIFQWHDCTSSTLVQL